MLLIYIGRRYYLFDVYKSKKQNHENRTRNCYNLSWERKYVCYFDWKRNIEDVRKGMKHKNTSYVLFVLEKEISNDDTKTENINELCLEEIYNPVYLKDVDML